MQRVVAGVACRFEERIADILAPGVVRMGLALGCNLSWSHMAFESLGLFHDQPDAEVVLDTVYLISIACELLTYLIVALVCHCGRKFAGSRSTCGLVSLSAAASTVVMHGATTTTAIGGACIVIGGIGSGVATSLFMMYFGIALSTMRTKRVMAISAIGYIVSTVLFSVYLFFEPFAAMVLCASMLPIAAALLVFGSMGAASGPCSQGETPPSRNLVSPEDCRQLKGLVRAFSVCMLVSGFVYEIARTVFIQVGGFAGETVENYAFAQGVVAALVLLAAIGITLVIVSSSNVHAPEICYRISACCLVVSALLILMPIVYPDASVVVPLAINNASFMCLNMLMWVLVCGVCNQLSDSSARFFALFRAAWTAGPLLGMLVGRFLYFSCGYTLQAAFLAMAASVLALFAMLEFVFTEERLSRALSIMPIERKRRFVERCNAVIEQYGLTEREGEIMVMFAKGRNLPYVMEELVLSKSTVSTHRQHIYKKLGVHSAQEMIDVIQNVTLRG